MLHPNKLINSLLCLSLLFIAACSGGTGGTGANSGSSTVVVGTITQLSTSAPTAFQQVTAAATSGGNIVTINGVQFDVSSSAISLDGISGTDADLRVGMVATIKGTISNTGTTGTANTLSISEAIKGPVTAIDTVNNTLTVLGQTIQASATTQWDNTDINTLLTNDIVEVSGYVKNNNVIAATRIELLSNTVTDFKITGTITNLSISSQTFSLGTLLVNYSGADLSAVTNSTLSNGMYVEVNGTLTSNTTTLNATKVSTDQLEISSADSVELQGFVTSTSGTTSVTSFQLNHQAVQIDNNTLFSGGAVTDIVPGVSVEVQGALVNGMFTAGLITFEDSVNITAVVNTANTSSFTLVDLGTLTISGDASTEFDSGSITMTKMSDIKPGYTVTIHGNLASSSNSNNVIATQISLDSTSPSSSTDVSLQGPIDAIGTGGSSVTMLGVTIDTTLGSTSIPDGNFVVEGSTTAPSHDYFFSVVNPGFVVGVQGTLDTNTSTITWNSMSYEPPTN